MNPESKFLCSKGPDTNNLSLRFGMHSGPVTAGVLQGEKSRFQLFGDTVNTASRMESTGEKGRIHISKSTADHLVASGKGHWLESREGGVQAKGKGTLQTFWVVRSRKTLKSKKTSENHSSFDNSDSDRSALSFSDSEQMTTSQSSASSFFDQSRSTQGVGWTNSSPPSKNVALYDLPAVSSRGSQTDLVEWHVETMGNYLKQILWQRNRLGISSDHVKDPANALPRGTCIFDEVSETISLASTVETSLLSKSELACFPLLQSVESQLRDYISTVVESHRGAPFHNFAHTTHVSIFVHKFLQKIARRGSPSLAECASIIASDSMLQFGLMFAALIHDMDHPGVSNQVLKNRESKLSRMYKGRLIAEQHALDLAWELLMDPCYSDLQQAIFSTRIELARFRQIVVNLVLATDLSDKEMVGIRALRWNEAFSSPPTNVINAGETRRQQVSVMTELLLQVADVSHTMQAWNVYLQWNQNCFREAQRAYKAGRAEIDPAKAWYARENFFFDKRAIPLVERLHKSGLLNCDNLLENVRFNRTEWQLRGSQCVKKMVTDSRSPGGKGQGIKVMSHEGNSSYRFSLEGEADPFHPSR